MAYSEWQISRLRSRISRYRKEEPLNGKDRAWWRVAMDILDAEEIPDAYMKDEDVDIFSESLRRFAAASQVPSQQRLDAIRVFLLEKAYLAKVDLEEQSVPYQAAFAMLEYLGSEELERPMAEKIKGKYRAVHSGNEKRFEVTELEFLPAENSNVVQVEERVSYYKARKNRPFGDWSEAERRKFRMATHKSRGWAVSTPENLVYVFLRDPVPDRPFSYMVLAYPLAEPPEDEPLPLTAVRYDAIADVLPERNRAKLPENTTAEAFVDRWYDDKRREFWPVNEP